MSIPKFYNIETEEIINLAELMTHYDTLRAENETEAATFSDYLENCLTRNNGTLQPI